MSFAVAPDLILKFTILCRGHSSYDLVGSAGRVELWQPLCFGVEHYKSPDLEFVFGHDSARRAQLSLNRSTGRTIATKKAPQLDDGGAQLPLWCSVQRDYSLHKAA